MYDLEDAMYAASVLDINFDKLPKSFVIKTNCGSGDVLIIKDKTNVNLELIKNYFKDNDPKKGPVVSWRSHANLLYSNWLNYFVYQTTPYDIEKIKK